STGASKARTASSMTGKAALGILTLRPAALALLLRGRRAEQNMSQIVLLPRAGQFILVAMDARPAVTPFVVVAHRAVVVVRLRVIGVRLVHPAGLRYAHSLRVLMAWEDVQQRDLLGQGELAL